MKVLSVIPGKKEDFSMIFAKRQAAAVENKGIQNKIFYLTSRSNPFKLFRLYLEFRKTVSEFSPDIIHSHYGTVTAFFAAFSSFRPLVITFHGSDIYSVAESNFISNFIRKFLSHLALLRAKAAFCVSRNIHSGLWWGKKKTSILPVGIDINFFYPLPKEDARKSLNWNNDDKILLFNGSDPGRKRLDIAQKTIEIIKEKIPDAKMVVLSGNTNPSEIPLYMNASDCVLVCSDSEGSPMIVKEAMACNIPIVSTDVGDVKERLKGVAECIIAEKNPEALANEIYKILQKGVRSDGRERIIKDKLSEDDITEKIISVYNSIINTKI